MTRETRHVLLFPLLTWAGLLLLLAATLGYAYLPDAPAKSAVGLAVAAAKAGLIAAVFMQLRSASTLVRLAATIGLGWLSLLFLFGFADFLTR